LTGFVEFWRTSYITEAELARTIGVSDSSLNEWLSDKRRPAKLERIHAFLDRLE